MKTRYFAALLLALLLALGASAQALADEPAQEGAFRDAAPEEGVFQNGSFSGPQTIPGEPMAVAESWEEDAYQLLLNAWRQRETEINVLPLRIPWADINAFWDVGRKVLNDHPELFYADFYGTAYSSGGLVARQTFKYRSFPDLDGAIRDFDAAANRALAQVRGLTNPVEIALILHDWLVVNCEYNWEVNKALENGGVGDTSQYDGGMPWTAYGALVNGTPVCQGYALAYKYLLSKADVPVPSVVISSDSMNHAWNGVQINGLWYQADATWDDPVLNREGRARHAYFLLSDSTFGTADTSKGRSAHSGWEQIVTCGSNAYESGYVFVDNEHPLYRRNNAFYYVKPESAAGVNGYSSYNCNSVYRTAALNSDGTKLAGGLGLSSNAVISWVDGRLYVLPGPFSGQVAEKVLLVYDLDSGLTAQAGHFIHSPAASPDGFALAGSDNYPGLRYNARTNEIEAVSCTRRTVVYSVPAASLSSGWSHAQTESGAGVASGLSPDGTAAAVLWGSGSSLPSGLTLWAAFYNGSGKLLKCQMIDSDAIARANISNVRPGMVLAYLDPPSGYASVKLMLLTSDKAPVCAAG